MRSSAQPDEAATPQLSPAQLLQLALAHRTAGRLDEAEAVCRAVLERAPRNAAARHMLGVVASDRGNATLAIEHIRKAIELDGGNHALHADLGRLFMLSERHADAEQAFRRASMLCSEKSYHDSLGNALLRQDKFDEAEASYRRAIALDANYASAYRNLADLFQLQGRHSEAFDLSRQALALQPGDPDRYTSIGALLQAEGDYVGAIDYFREAVARAPGNPAPIDNLLLSLSFQDSPQAYLQAARRRGDELLQRARDNPLGTMPARGADAALRVGFVSGDLRKHPVGIFLESVLARLSAGPLELFAYSSAPVVDALNERIRPFFAAWRAIDRLPDIDIARLVRSDRIDILVDLSGYTAHNRLEAFAWKPAPVQVTWLGYWASTGLAAIDYILADRHSLPPEEAAQYVEKPWYLPETRLCFTPPRDAGEVAPAPVLRNGYITFGCFNHPAKIHDGVVALWARVLQYLPDSRLLLKARQFVDAPFAARMRARFAAHGIDPARVLLQPHSPPAAYFAAYGDIDIALDPFPYTGGTTSVDGLWMGVPFITLRGDRMLAHQGESILHNVGLPDWIAADADAYVALAARHGGDRARLARLRGELRARLQASPLCDAARFAAHLEAAFIGMWQAHLQQEGPAGTA